MIAIDNNLPNEVDDRTSWEGVLRRVIGGINGAANPGEVRVTVDGSTPTVYTPGAPGTMDYMPLLLIALVVVAIVVLSK